MADSLNLNVRLEGAVVEGRAPALVDRMLISATAELADYTKFEVLQQLDRVLKNPTGYYESQVRADPDGVYRWSVNDGGVIYGPWLEGIGSRNYPVTKFEGYHTFRTVRNRMAQKASAVIAADVARLVAEL